VSHLHEHVTVRPTAASSWIEKRWETDAESCDFPTEAAADYRQRRLWVLTISILPLNPPPMEDFQPQILYFWMKIFPTRRKFFGMIKFLRWTISPVPHLSRRHWPPVVGAILVHLSLYVSLEFVI